MTCFVFSQPQDEYLYFLPIKSYLVLPRKDSSVTCPHGDFYMILLSLYLEQQDLYLDFCKAALFQFLLKKSATSQTFCTDLN